MKSAIGPELNSGNPNWLQWRLHVTNCYDLVQDITLNCCRKNMEVWLFHGIHWTHWSLAMDMYIRELPHWLRWWVVTSPVLHEAFTYGHTKLSSLRYNSNRYNSNVKWPWKAIVWLRKKYVSCVKALIGTSIVGKNRKSWNLWSVVVWYWSVSPIPFRVVNTS